MMPRGLEVAAREREPSLITVATLGAAYSANKGAASMMQALVDRLPERIGPTRFVAVSTHPTADLKAYDRASLAVKVVSQRPVEMALVQVPLALLAGALRTARLPWRWLCRPAALRAIADADVVADLSGISFVDGRRFVVLVYNALLVLVPLALGRPVVKCAQAMGPFRTTINRSLARVVLPRLRAICPRGQSTERYLRGLRLDNLRPAADLAFAMEVPQSVRQGMKARLERASSPYLVVAPSQVVDTQCATRGIDYQGIVAELIEAVVARTGHTVVVIAHSAEPTAGANHMNDLPLCRAIVGRLSTTDRVLFFDEDLLPTELRAIIGEARLLVTSRFHAMVSALGERRPMLVIGWSHKYAEVLEPFGLADAAIPYSDLSTGEAIVKQVEELLARADDVSAQIERRLPEVVASAITNFEVLADVVGAPRVAR